MIKITDKKMCCGCTACQNICPIHCITMEPDSEGFLYPHADSASCIQCGLCDQVCPVINADSPPRKSDIFFCQNNDDNIRLKSTSGGVFAALAQVTLEQHGHVYGAGYGTHMQVLHKCAKKMEQVFDLMMSKYVQSDLDYTFQNIKKDISEGKTVLFTGTPCQAEGLYYFMRNTPSDRLLIVDLACYGVPSPKVYQKWIETLESEYKSEIDQIYFRDKKYGYAGVNIKVVLKNGVVLEDQTDVKTFTKTMFSGIGLRPSCYTCPFRNTEKKCDLTLSDGWSVQKYVPDMDDNKGTTKVLAHTTKALEALKQARNLTIVQTGLRPATLPYGTNRECHTQRTEFFNDLDRLEYTQLIKKYIPETLKDKLANTLKPVIRQMPASDTLFRILKKYKNWRKEKNARI